MNDERDQITQALYALWIGFILGALAIAYLSSCGQGLPPRQIEQIPAQDPVEEPTPEPVAGTCDCECVGPFLPAVQWRLVE